MSRFVNRKVALLSSFLILTLGVSAFAKPKSVTLAGWISDENCGARHTKPGGADCIRKCMHGGQDIGHPEWKPQRAVFVADADKKVWVVENPEAIKGQEGQRVRVIGRLDATRNSIRVARVTLLEEEKK